MGFGQIAVWMPGAADPIAETKEVIWRPATAATVAKIGQPVAYNSDATFDVEEKSSNPNSEGSTYQEGNQSYTGRLFLVEEVKDTEWDAFAGVVASLGPLAGADGDRIQIYVPNGAIVPVWTDKNIARKDRLYLENGEQTVVNATQTGMGPCIGEAWETIDRSNTAGLVWAKLTPIQEKNRYPGTLGVAPSELLWEDCPWDEISRNPGVGATYFDDYIGVSNTTTAEGWVITQTTSGTMLPAAVEGGALLLDTAGHASADDGIECQLLNCRFLPAAGKTIWFEARVKMNDATDQYFVGLAATDTSIIPAGAMDDAVDKCGFVHLAASTDNKISSITSRTSEDDLTADVADNTDATYMTLGFRITGLTSVEFYVNGALVETCTTAAAIPNSAMCLTLVCKTEDTDADAEMTVDWVKIAQLGARA